MNKTLALPKFILDMAPIWSYECPSCHDIVTEKDYNCKKCGVEFTPLQSRVPWYGWKDKKVFSDFVHNEIIPKVPKYWKDYLLKRFTILFQDFFESGDFSAWTGTTVTSGDSITVQDTIKHHGTYAANSTVSGIGWRDAYAYKTFAGVTTAYARAYIYIDSYTGSETRGFLGLHTTGINMIRVGINGATNRYLYMQYYNNGAFFATSATALALDTWYSLEIKVVISTTEGEYRVYLDGSEVLDLAKAGMNSGTIAITRTHAGIHAGNGVTATVYVDCVVVADTYIGLEPKASKLIIVKPQI